jgi:hypothetical protein
MLSVIGATGYGVLQYLKMYELKNNGVLVTYAARRKEV